MSPRDPAVGSQGAPVGAFVGLATLDLVLGVEHVPGPDEKIVATSQLVVAGGPAANAAVAFAWAGGRPRLLAVLGGHPLAAAALLDLQANGVAVVDADPGRAAPPTVAAILVTTGTGARAVVSHTDRSTAGAPEAAGQRLVAELLDGTRIVLADGHHRALAVPLARAARARGIRLLLDGGTWRPAFDELIPGAEAVVASAAFRPPGAGPAADGVLRAILARGARFAAITAGSDPIRWRDAAGRTGSLEVPAGEVIDTLGAGDVLHGVMAALLAAEPGDASTTDDLVAALAEGARVASASCAYEGTRAWLAAPIPGAERRP